MMAYVRCNGQCSRAFARMMANLVRDLQYWGIPTWVLWLLLAGCVVAIVTLVVQLRRPYRRPLQRRTMRLTPIPAAEAERRTHRRVGDWTDKLRDDRRIT